MAHDLKYAPLFRADFADTLHYIRDTLKNPIAADNLIASFDTAASSVSASPCVTKPIMAGNPQEVYYYTRVKNYLAFYVVYENTVEFPRFLYAHSDLIAKLK